MRLNPGICSTFIDFVSYTFDKYLITHVLKEWAYRVIVKNTKINIKEQNKNQLQTKNKNVAPFKYIAASDKVNFKCD